jgi:hypothetical protein
MTRGITAAAALAGVLLLANCDDGRMETIDGPMPAAEPMPADTPWDTLHPPVPPAPGVEAPATTDPAGQPPPEPNAAGPGEPGRTDAVTGG